MPVIMGTAGHIDHGKTSLVKALTGIDCDRLSEEKKRGITIELGFAHLDLSGGTRLSIVDVPGHEKFVKNMVAGAAGIDFVTLVIAADEGVMPQTREHLEICSLLGVSRGLVALTKTDMVDAEWLELVTEDIRGALAGTFLEESPILGVSSRTGEGLEELREALARMAGEVDPERRDDLVRLPVDRVFSMKGYGTVVTGTLLGGTLSVGDEVVLYPRGTNGKVRGLQSHGETVETAPAGRRTAVNLPGLEVADIERGEIVARPGTLFPSEAWDVELTCLSSSPRPLKHRTELHFHHGSREVLARLHLLDRDVLKPGERAVCQMRFPEPLAGVRDDRVVLRSFAPLRTVAGGRLINPLGRRVKRRSDDLEKLSSLVVDDAESVVRTQLSLAGSQGLSFAQLRILTRLDGKALEKLMQQMAGRQDAQLFSREDRRYAGGDVVSDLTGAAVAFLGDFHRREPMRPGISRGALAAVWGDDADARLVHFLVERMLKRGEVEAEGDVLKLPGHRVSLAADEQGLKARIAEAYAGGGLTPPNLRDVLEPLGVSAKEAAGVYRLLCEEGTLVRVKEEMYFHQPAVAGLMDNVREFLREKGEMGPQDFRELTQLSRKYAIPLLEYFDKEKLTIRVGDFRRLRGA